MIATTKASNVVNGILGRHRNKHMLSLGQRRGKTFLPPANNLKHRTMVSLIYACGLRRKESLNLRIKHVDSKRNMLIIRHSKGYKDRQMPISDKTIEMLGEFAKMHRLKVWLFEGQKDGEMYSEESLAKVLKHAVNKANIRKPVTLN